MNFNIIINHESPVALILSNNLFSASKSTNAVYRDQYDVLEFFGLPIADTFFIPSRIISRNSLQIYLH